MVNLWGRGVNNKLAFSTDFSWRWGEEKKKKVVLKIKKGLFDNYLLCILTVMHHYIGCFTPYQQLRLYHGINRKGQKQQQEKL